MSSTDEPASETHAGFLYGRVTTDDGETYEGRLRFGGDEEAFWGDYFNGFKDENPWAAHVPPDRLPTKRHEIEVFGIELWHVDSQLDLGRPFMARFGDIARIEARDRDIRVSLKSGTVFDLDRFAADDLADGVRVWDTTRGVVDLGEWRIRTIELLPEFSPSAVPNGLQAAAPSPGAAAERLHGTVRTRQGEFTGFIQWNREKGVGTDELAGHTGDRVGLDELNDDTADRVVLEELDGHTADRVGLEELDGHTGDRVGLDELNDDTADRDGLHELDGHTADGEISLRFDTIRSIERRARGSSLVTLRDGREIVLSGTSDVGPGNRGMYVDDPRYGRVLIGWDAFERVDFSPGGSGPGYADFPQGRPLTGSVTTRAGRRLAGRLVYDLDESETTETLDAPSRGVHYTIPFGLIASLVPPGRDERGADHAAESGVEGSTESGAERSTESRAKRFAESGAKRARVTLHSGEVLQLEPSGDLGEGNAGMLIFTGGRDRPEYVPWADVERVEFDRPPAMYPPRGGR
jgi:hypothetical protein